MISSTSEAVILLKDIQGEKLNLGILEGLFKSNVRPVHRGELLVALPEAKITKRKDGKPAHNYHLANDQYVTLFCTEHDVAPLSDYEYRLMVAIKSREARYEVFLKDILDWGSKLKIGNCVFVTLPSVSNKSTLSMIKYIGPLPKEHGIQLGVEILVGTCNATYDMWTLTLL